MINKIKELWADSTNRKVIILFIGIVILLIISLFFSAEQNGTANAIKSSIYRTKKICCVTSWMI